jgi:hypothetical protein
MRGPRDGYGCLEWLRVVEKLAAAALAAVTLYSTQWAPVYATPGRGLGPRPARSRGRRNHFHTPPPPPPPVSRVCFVHHWHYGITNEITFYRQRA